MYMQIKFLSRSTFWNESVNIERKLLDKSFVTTYWVKLCLSTEDSLNHFTKNTN